MLLLSESKRPEIRSVVHSHSSHTGRERFPLSRFPLGCSFERLHRASFIEMDDRIELFSQSGFEIVTCSFRLRQIDDTNRSLEQWLRDIDQTPFAIIKN